MDEVGLVGTAIGNVLRRKRAQRLELEHEYALATTKNAEGKYESPKRGLYADIESLGAQIQILEHAADEVLQCQQSLKTNVVPLVQPSPPNAAKGS